jgi:hypothetical protein
MSSMVMIRCPVTDETVASGLLMARDAFTVLRTKNTDIRCPACGELHSWLEVTAWLARVRYPGNLRSRRAGLTSLIWWAQHVAPEHNDNSLVTSGSHETTAPTTNQLGSRANCHL